MDIEIETLIAIYKEELRKLQDENIALKCKLVQILKNKEKQGAEEDGNS